MYAVINCLLYYETKPILLCVQDTAGSPSGEPPRQSPAQPPATNHTKTRPNSTTRAATTPTTTPTPPTHQTTLRNKPSRSPRLTNPSHSKEKKTKNKSSSSHAQPRPEKSRAASLGHLVSDTASEGKRNDNKAHVRAAGKAEKGGKRSVKKEPEAGGSRASVTGEGDSVVVTMNEGDSAGTQSRSLVVTTPSPVQQMGLPLGLYSLPSPSPLSLSSSSPLGMLFYGPPQVLSSPVQPGSPSLSAGVVPSPLSPFVHLGLFPASGNPSAASPAETYPSFGMNMSRDQTSNSDKSATIPKRRGGVKKKHSQKRRASISAIPYSHSTPADGERDCSPTATCKSSPSTQTTPSKPEEGERDGSNLPPQTTQTTPSKPEEGERDRSNLPPQTTQTTPSKPEEGERDGSNLPPQTTQTTPSSDRLGHEQLSGSGELQTPTDGTSFIPSLASSTHPPSSLPSLPPAYSTTFLSSLAPPTSSQSHTQHPLTTHSSLPLTSSHNISAHHQNNSITTRRYSNSVTHRSPSHVTRDPNRHAHSNSTKVSRTRSITTSAGSSGSSVKTGSSSKLCRSSSSHHRRSSVPAAPSLSSLPAVAPPTTQYHSSTATAASVPLSSAPSVSPSLSVAPPCPSSLPSSFNSLPASLSATASHLEPTTNYCKPNSSTTPITTPTTTPTATPTTNSSTAPITTPTTKSSSTPLTTPTITPTSVTAFAAAANASIGSCIPSCVGRANTRPGSVNCEQNAHTMQSLCDVLATSDMEKFTVSESRLLLQEPYGVVNIYKQTNVTSSKPDPSAPPRNRSRVTAARTPKKVTAARTPKKQTDNRASRKGSKGTIEGSKPSSVSASTVGTASTMGTASTVGTYSNAVQVSAPVSKDFKQRPLHSSLPGLGGVSVGSCSNALVSNNLYRSHCPETDPNSIVNSEIGTKSSARPQSLETTRSGEKSARRVRKETPQSRRRNGSTASSKSSSRRPSRSESLQLPFFLSAEPEEVFGPGSVIPLGLNSLVPQLPTDLLFYSTAGGPASLMSVPPRVSESLPRVEPTSTSASFSGSVASTSLLRSRVHSLSQSSVGHTHNHHNRQTHSQHSVHGNYQQITTESISVKWEEQQYPFVPTAPITTPTATTTETGVGTMKKKNSASERRLEVAQPLPSLLSLHSLEGLQIAIAASSGQPMMSLPDRPKPKVSASVAGKTTSPSDKMRSSPGVTMMSPLGEMTSPASKVSKRPRLSSSERKRQKKKTPAANVQSTIAGRVKLADGSLTKPALPGPQSVLPQSRTAVPHTSMPYIAISHTAIPHATLLPGRAVAETPTPTPNTPPMLFGTAAGMTGFIPGLAGMNTGQPILIPGQPSLPFDQPTIIAGQSSSPLFSSSPDTAYSKNLAYWEMERLYYHNVALLEQQRKYTEFLESELKQMERAQIDAGNRVSEKQQQIYQQFLNYVAEPDYTPDVPLPFPECSQSQLEKTSEFKGTFDNPVLPPELDYYATFLRQINSHNVELKKPPSSTT